jgi:uncharacterized protein (TIGR02391 family)
MVIKDLVSLEIYEAVRTKYESGLYSDAIIEAIKALTNLIREKGNVDGDGASLIGQAFGGNSPKIKLNRMQTNSEIDEQKGFEQILRGLYIGIRNPRIHESYQDSQEDANSVIIFTDYIFKTINRTRSFFQLDEFRIRVFDSLFVERDDYAELIVNEIPYDELENTAVSILKDRNRGDPNKLDYFFRAIFNKADPDQTERIVKAFSNELKIVHTAIDIVDVIRYLVGKLWAMVDEDVKMRTESSMITSVKEAYYDIYSGGIQKGHLGTWASTRGEYFKLRKELAVAITEILAKNWYTQNYVAEYFLFHLDDIFKEDNEIRECCSMIAYATMGNKARHFRTKLENHFNYLPKKWRDIILEYGLKYKEEDEEYFNRLSRANDIPF